MRRASHQGRKVASPAATVANRKPSAKTADDGRSDAEPDADPERRQLLLELERRQLELEPDERARVLGDPLGESAEALGVGVSRVSGHYLSSRSPSPTRFRR